jgi:chloramphenicol-sensitive protein RarD|tara:strand:- start:202 stop:1083 length:882 start_codon:yes stop_codon:yes gene_type:complete
MINVTNFNKGIISSSVGSFWWGVIGTYYFQYIAFVGTFEVVVHRCIWTTLILLITTTFFNKWHLFKEIIINKKKLFVLMITSFLIFGNWTIWIYAVATNRIIDASFGYFIFPIISVFFGFIFFKEKLNKKRIISISLVIISTVYLLFNFDSLPWVGFAVAFLWSIYNLLRKKINVDTDIGLFIESLFILPLAIIILYFIIQNNVNDFSLSNPSLMALLFLAGPMTVIPLFLYVKGVELSGLGPSGMIFFITPTGQFLLGFFYYNEIFSIHKFLSFILIWIAVSIYLKDLYEHN